jgi:hypothetical protein
VRNLSTIAHTRQHRDAVAGHKPQKLVEVCLATVGALVALTRAAVTCFRQQTDRLTRTCGRIDTESWKALNESIDKPLLNGTARHLPAWPDYKLPTYGYGRCKPANAQRVRGHQRQRFLHLWRPHLSQPRRHRLWPRSHYKSIVKSSNVLLPLAGQ